MNGAEHNESAEAADLEPTMADVCAGETQSIYAWSQDHDADTELIQRRSWKLPLAVAGIAIAAVAGGIIYAWPQHQKFAAQPAQKQPLPAQTQQTQAPAAALPAPSQQTSPPVQPMNPDQRFIDAVSQYYGWSIPADQRDAMLAIGRFACSDLQHGKSISETANDLQTLGIDGQQDRLALATST